MGAQSSALLGADSVPVAHLKAWAPFLRWAGPAAPQLSQALQGVQGQRVPVASLSGLLRLSDAQVAAWSSQGSAEVVSVIPRTGVSSEDLLISLQMLFEDCVASAPESAASAPELEGVPGELIEKLQEALDGMVENGGPEKATEVVEAAQLQRALQQSGIPLISWAALLTQLAREIDEKGMGGAAAGDAAGAAPAAAAPSASAAAAAAPRKPASASSKGRSAGAGSSGGMMGGGLDLSISGFAIKPPGKK